MKRFTQRSKDMDPELEAFAYPTLDLKIARFIELHVNSKTNTITFTPERFRELSEYISSRGGRKTPIRNHNLKPLRDANIIKFVWTNNGGQMVYMMNPRWSSQFSDADQEKYTELYDRFVDGEGMKNIKIKYGNVGIEDELEDTEENEREEESNKSYHEVKDLRGEPKEIVVHPEEEVIAEVKNYNPVVTPLELLHSMDDEKPFINQKVPELDATMKGNKKSKRMCLGGQMTVEEMNKFWDE